MPLEFLDTSQNHRLGIFTEMLSTIAASEDDRELHRSLVGLMRRAFKVRCYAEASSVGLPAGSFRLTRVWRADGSEGVEDRSPWRIDGVAVRAGGVIAELLARGSAGAVNRLLIPADDPVYRELGMYRSVCAAPGGVGSKDNWVLVFDTNPDVFTSEDVETLVLRLNLISLSLRNLRTLADLRVATANTNAEVDRIATIQRSLLPKPFPPTPGLDVAAICVTSNRAGGDLYDYAKLENGRWAFLIADASGHGPSAAVVSAMLSAIVHTLPATRASGSTGAGAALGYANSQLAARRIEQSFVTAFLCMWDPTANTLTYARAGHNPPLFCRHGQPIRRLEMVGEPPLAVLDDTRYSEHVEPLMPGDLVVLFTDGITEAANGRGEMFGDERLVEAVKNAHGSSRDVLNQIVSTVRTFEAGAEIRDDQTLLVLRFG